MNNTKASHAWNAGKKWMKKQSLSTLKMADEIFVINVGGNIGSSTNSEIESARATGKLVHYLEDD